MKICDYFECNRKYYARGFCKLHYYRLKKEGILSNIRHHNRYFSGQLCRGPECDRQAIDINMCSVHAKDTRKGIPLRPIGYQDNCDICGEFAFLRRDHDSTCCPTNKFPRCGNCERGDLCDYCNHSLGKVKDNPVILNRMINYILEHNQEAYV